MALALLALPTLAARPVQAQSSGGVAPVAPSDGTSTPGAPPTSPTTTPPATGSESALPPTMTSSSAAPVAGATAGTGTGGLPSIDRVLAMVRTDAPDVALGQAAVVASRANSVGARRLPLGNPQLTVFAEYGEGATRDVFIDGQLEVPIEIWGQRGRRIAEADAFIDYTQASLEVMRAESIAQAIEAYGQVTVSLDRLGVVQDAIVVAKAEADVYTARVEQRDATVRDSHVATMEVARNEILLIEARADLQDGLAQLERLTGTRYAPEGSSGSAIPPDDALSWAQRERASDAPVVRESKAEASYYGKVGERAAAEGKMPFSVLLRGGRGDFAETRLGGGFVLGFPFFNYNQGERARAAAQAERARRTAAIQERALEAVIAGVRRELEQLREARRILDDVALPAAGQAASAAEEIQRAGKSDLLPVLISRRDYAALRLRRLDILAREWRAVGNIVRITGTQP